MTDPEMFELLCVIDPRAERLPLELVEFGRAIERRVRAEYAPIGRAYSVLGTPGVVIAWDIDPTTFEPATVLYVAKGNE